MLKHLGLVLVTAAAGAMFTVAPAHAAEPGSLPTVAFHETCAFVEVRIETTQTVWVQIAEKITDATEQRMVGGPFTYRELTSTVQVQFLDADKKVLVPMTEYVRKAPISCVLPLTIESTAMCEDSTLAVALINDTNAPTTPFSVYKGAEPVAADITLAARSMRYLAVSGVSDLFIRYGTGDDVFAKLTYSLPDDCHDRTGPVGQPLPVGTATFTDTCTGVRVGTAPNNSGIKAHIYGLNQTLTVFPSDNGGIIMIWLPSPADVPMQEGELLIVNRLFSQVGGVDDDADIAAHVYTKPADCNGSGGGGGGGGALPVTGSRTALTMTGAGAALVLLGVAAFAIGRRRRAHVR